jgi:hypothetical protein
VINLAYLSLLLMGRSVEFLRLLWTSVAFSATKPRWHMAALFNHRIPLAAVDQHVQRGAD